MNQQAHDTYLRMQVNTAAPWELTALLFNGCIKFMKQAQDDMKSNDYQSKNYNIKRATDIINELSYTLDRNYDVAQRLDTLYEYINRKLMMANMKMDADSLSESIQLMTELKDTWVQSMKQYQQSVKVRS